MTNKTKVQTRESGQSDLEKDLGDIKYLQTPVGKAAYLWEVEQKYAGNLSGKDKERIDAIRNQYTEGVQEAYMQEIAKFEGYLGLPKGKWEVDVQTENGDEMSKSEILWYALKNIALTNKQTRIPLDLEEQKGKEIHKSLIDAIGRDNYHWFIKNFREATGILPSQEDADRLYDKEILEEGGFYNIPGNIYSRIIKGIEKPNWDKIKEHIEEIGIGPSQELMEKKYKELLSSNRLYGLRNREERGYTFVNWDERWSLVNEGISITGTRPNEEGLRLRIKKDLERIIERREDELLKDINFTLEFGDISLNEEEIKEVINGIKGDGFLLDQLRLCKETRSDLRQIIGKTKLSKEYEEELVKDSIEKKDWRYFESLKEIGINAEAQYTEDLIQQKQREYLKEEIKVDFLSPIDNFIESIEITNVIPLRDDLNKAYNLLVNLMDKGKERPMGRIEDIITATGVLPENIEVAKEIGPKVAEELEKKGEGIKAIGIRKGLERLV